MAEEDAAEEEDTVYQRYEALQFIYEIKDIKF